MKKVRDSNFELMRINSMFLIVIYHFIILMGGNLINLTEGKLNSLITLICFITVVHVNSFILVTGYFQYNKKINIKKIISLVFMVYFYKVVITLIFMKFNICNYGTLDLYKAFSPLEMDNYWFIKCYLLLYILSPYINIVIKKLNQKEHKNLIILLFVLFSIIPTVTNQRTFSNIGFSTIHFIYVYLIGSYFAKYPLKNNIHFKNYSSKKTAIILFSLFIAFGLIRFLMYEYCSKILTTTDGTLLFELRNIIINNIYNYQTPLLIFQSVCYFLFFETFKFKSKIINTISSCIFSIYLITENNSIKKILYKWLGIGKEIIHANMLPRIFFYCILIMIAGIVIELVRKQITRLIIFIYKSLEKKIKTIN